MLKQTCLLFGFIGFFALGTSHFANAAEKGDPIKGKQPFAANCVSCHGSTGKGDGPAAASFQPKPRSLSDAKYVSTLSDEHMFKTISEGGAAMGKAPLMPSFKSVLPEADIWNVIAYLRKNICKCEYKEEEKGNK